ncbi:MAG TPA: DUF3300 domain-containing protein, partial [Stellaceae bacterium]|nr:DUF3300 domain-containing protein [Stellaceae bacterium]
MKALARALLVAGALAVVLLPSVAPTQTMPPPPPPSAAAPVMTAQQLDQLLAPVALYPDPLLAQILMAATYPLEVVAADRWQSDPANAQLAGDALAAAAAQQGWDPSVQSLVPFPQLLRMMDSRLDWLQQLGDAFIAQQPDVMAAVQRLRAEALAAGTLAANQYQSVSTANEAIVIEPANPAMVYVPYYDCAAVYGVWPYPGYPPICFPPPPGYGVPILGLAFGVGFAIVPTLWGWDHWDWEHYRLQVDRDRFNRLDQGRPPIAGDTWQHDASRRGAVPSRVPAVRERTQTALPGSVETRRAYRGFSEGAGAPARPAAAAPAARPAEVQRPAFTAAPAARAPAARPGEVQRPAVSAAPAARPVEVQRPAFSAAPTARAPAARPVEVQRPAFTAAPTA